MKKQVATLRQAFDLEPRAKGQPRLKTFFMNVSITKTPIKWHDDITTRDDLLTTDGIYYLRYMKYTKLGTRAPAYIIYGDVFKYKLGHLTIRARDWNDFVGNVVPKNEIIKFIYEFSTVTPEHFALARKNPGIVIPFCFDIVKYTKVTGSSLISTEGQVIQIRNWNHDMRNPEWIALKRRAMSKGGLMKDGFWDMEKLAPERDSGVGKNMKEAEGETHRMKAVKEECS